MNSVFFKIVGIFAFIMEAVLIWAYVTSLVMQDMAAAELIGLSVRVGGTVLFMNVIGIGLFYSRRWAAVFASIFFTYTGMRLLYDVSSMLGGRIWLVVLLAIFSFVPFIGTVKYWKSLKPGGRWYF